jgi:pimeloyl-ACP methyl ester carboxylesterase
MAPEERAWITSSTPQRFETAAGVTIAGEAWGPVSGLPVLFIHGGGQTRHSWKQTAQYVASQGEYRAITIDLRGHGESDYAPDGDYRLDRFVEDIAGVVSHLSQPPVFVGASLGGMIAILLVGEQEMSASGVVLVDVAPRLEDAGVERIFSFMQSHEDGFDSLEEAAAAVEDYLPHRKRPLDISGLEKNLRKGEDGRYYWHWDQRMLQHAHNEKARHEERLLAAAQSITVPVLLLRGVLSDVVSKEVAAEFQQAVPHARHLDITDAAHTVAGDSNSAFTEAVLSFLQDVNKSDIRT